MKEHQRSSRIDWETLSAYVDGALSSADRFRVEAQVERDAATRAQLEALYARKMALHERRAGGGAVRRWRAWPSFVVASLLAVAFVAVTALAPFRARYSDPLVAIVKVHERWAEGGTATERVAGRLSTAALPRRSGFEGGVLVPELDSARLRLVRGEWVELSPLGRTLHLGYAGTRGCRLSVFVSPAGKAALSDAPERTTLNGTRLTAWRTGDVAYRVAATGMATERYELLVDVIHQSARRQAQPGTATRELLAANRRESRPCLG